MDPITNTNTNIPLPEGWEKSKDSQGNPIWVNKYTIFKTTKTFPTMTASEFVEDQMKKFNSELKKVKKDRLPEGSEMIEDSEKINNIDPNNSLYSSPPTYAEAIQDTKKNFNTDANEEHLRVDKNGNLPPTYPEAIQDTNNYFNTHVEPLRVDENGNLPPTYAQTIQSDFKANDLNYVNVLLKFNEQINLDLCLLLKTLKEKNKIKYDSFISKTIEKITVIEIDCDNNKIEDIFHKIIMIMELLNDSIKEKEILDFLLSKIISQIQKNINFYINIINKKKPPDDNERNIYKINKYENILSILDNLLTQMPTLKQSQNQDDDQSISKVESVEYIIETLLLILTGSQILGGKKTRRRRKGRKGKNSKKNKRSKNTSKKNKNKKGKKEKSRKSKKLIK